MASGTLTPEVLWAQRSSVADPEKNYVYLTISVPDIPKSKLKLDIQPQSLTFTGHSDTLKNTYHVELQFFDEVNPAESKTLHTPKNIEIKLQKKELKEEYWPRLLKDSKKVHFLKTDFDKWVDEDEQNEAAEDDFSNFGGMGGMPGMAGGDFGGIDFSKLGGGAGAGVPGGEEDSDDEDDEEVPNLEGDNEAEDGDKEKGEKEAAKDST